MLASSNQNTVITEREVPFGSVSEIEFPDSGNKNEIFEDDWFVCSLKVLGSDKWHGLWGMNKIRSIKSC